MGLGFGWLTVAQPEVERGGGAVLYWDLLCCSIDGSVGVELSEFCRNADVE